MNVQSVAHSYIQKQTNPLLNNDPLELKVVVKGVTNMNHKRNLENFALDLVAQYAIFDGENYNLSLKELSDSDQNELARLYIESTERDVGECVYGDDFSINSDYTCALLAMLKDDSKENRDNFAQITLRNIFIFYSQTLEDVIDTACNDYHCNMISEEGYYNTRDSDHGDFHWGKY